MLFAISFLLLLRSLLERLINNFDNNHGERYNLVRATRLIFTFLITYIVISYLFQLPSYSTLASLGLISLVLGFALQAPITSFIGWLYIIFRKPYQVGDRIQIDDFRGDVLEINYLDTIIEECSGDYLGNDHKSGRLIHFPNSIILKGKVVNYAGFESPFIWNETVLQIAYTSDIEFVEEVLLEAAEKDFKQRFSHQNFPFPDRFKSKVYFRNNKYAWMEAVIQYPVEPKDTTGKRNRILQEILPQLNASPEKVQFPEGVKR